MLDLKQKLKKVISMVKQSEARSKMIAALNVIDNSRVRPSSQAKSRDMFQVYSDDKAQR